MFKNSHITLTISQIAFIVEIGSRYIGLNPKDRVFWGYVNLLLGDWIALDHRRSVRQVSRPSYVLKFTPHEHSVTFFALSGYHWHY